MEGAYPPICTRTLGTPASGWPAARAAPICSIMRQITAAAMRWSRLETNTRVSDRVMASPAQATGRA